MNNSFLMLGHQGCEQKKNNDAECGLIVRKELKFLPMAENFPGAPDKDH